MTPLHLSTQSGTVLQGALFSEQPSDTVMIAITGIHGNFYSNPFYRNIGETLSRHGIDFIYAQTRDAFSKMAVINTQTHQKEIIGSFNEDFANAIDDVKAYVDYAEQAGYRRIILAGHSLGANKVIYYLSHTADCRIAKFVLLSPANITHLTNSVSEQERAFIRQHIENGRGETLLPFELFGWLPAQANTAYQWLYSDLLNNVHVEADGDFTQVERIQHTGALLIGRYDRFTYGDPAGFLQNINAHFPNAAQNELIFIDQTGHTYQQKEQKLADILRDLLQKWQK
ncbi:alpha/beta fold hydrolase [Rodentibacter sp. Ppn85]|uniref:alpha/beta fold hydrolase n=1 Tax=Rodentibacter sp. Ppn85 TaxID=1908525 RepID=UPI00098674F4|nr:alpha/beta fold hydrolase [Rodentibacter sp. Ppn85]OOF64157.1 alpha/beta hydrolase [Rodentibacter sp. Ppn85]